MLIKTGLAVAIIAAGIAAIVLFMGFADASGAANSLQTKINNDNKAAVVLENRNKSLNAEIQEIEKKTAEIMASIESASAKVPARMNPNMITEEIVYTGERNQVTVIPLSNRDWSNVKVGAHQYQVFKLDIEVNGDEPHVIKFLNALQSLSYQPLVIESVSLEKIDPSSLLATNLTVDPDSNMASVETVTARNILTNTATLYGNLVSLGVDNSSMAVSFEYGSDDKMINSTSKEVMLRPGVFSAELTNLNPGSLYYFRAKAEGRTIKYGDDYAFWTLQMAPLTPVSADINIDLSLAVYAK